MPRLTALVTTRLGPGLLTPLTPPLPARPDLGVACPAYRVPVQRLLEVCRFLQTDPDAGFETLLDLTLTDAGHADAQPAPGPEGGSGAGPAPGADAGAGAGSDEHATPGSGPAPAALTLLVTLANPVFGGRVRLAARLDDDLPAFPSLTSLWPAADILEREAAEFFGVQPDGHPDLRPLLLPDGFQGHPLLRSFSGGAAPMLQQPARRPSVVIDDAAAGDADDGGVRP